MQSREYLSAVVCIVGLSGGCGGRLDPLPQGEGQGAATGSIPTTLGPGPADASTTGSGSGSRSLVGSGTSGGTGTPGAVAGGQAPAPVADCSTMTPPDVIRICPDGSQGFASYVSVDGTCTVGYPCPSRPLGDCAPQAPCSASGPSCYVTSSVEDAGSISCVCDDTGQFECSLQHWPSGTTGCAQGSVCQSSVATCSDGVCGAGASGCGWATATANGEPGCSGSCGCDPSGHLACESTCGADGGLLPPECAGVTLPNFCDVCLDGTTACAFFTTTTSSITGNTVCAIETCPPSSAR